MNDVNIKISYGRIPWNEGEASEHDSYGDLTDEQKQRLKKRLKQSFLSMSEEDHLDRIILDGYAIDPDGYIHIDVMIMPNSGILTPDHDEITPDRGS